LIVPEIVVDLKLRLRDSPDLRARCADSALGRGKKRDGKSDYAKVGIGFMHDRSCADDGSGMPLPLSLRPNTDLKGDLPREERSRGSKVEKIVRLLVKTTSSSNLTA
jgi:hypothetical protein